MNAEAELALIGLGANLGDAAATLASARRELGRLGRITAVSSLYRTAPVGGPPGQPPYLNAVLQLEPRAGLSANQLLQELLAVERKHGRERRVHWEARTLDLDLLAFGRQVLQDSDLELPHPRMLERAFVLVPLVELLPGWVHPVSGVSAADALAKLDPAGVERLHGAWAEEGR